MHKGQREQHHEEIALHGLQTLRQQTLAVLVALRLHKISTADFRQEKNERHSHDNNIAHRQNIFYRAILSKNQAGQRNTCKIKTAEIASLNLAFEDIGCTGQEREYPIAAKAEPGSTANHQHVVNNTMSITGAAVQHTQDKEQPQHNQNVTLAHKEVRHQRQAAANEAAQIAVGVQLSCQHIAEQKAQRITKRTDYSISAVHACRAFPQRHGYGNKNSAHHRQLVALLVKINRSSQAKILAKTCGVIASDRLVASVFIHFLRHIITPRIKSF